MDEEQSEPGRLVDRRPAQADEREAEAVTRREAREAWVSPHKQGAGCSFSFSIAERGSPENVTA